MGTKKDTCGIYGIWCRENGKWYVGGSVGVHKRVKTHRSHVRCVIKAMEGRRPGRKTDRFDPDIERRYPLAADIKRFGWDAFEASLLEEVPNAADLQERERYWIDALDAKENGYNKSASGGHWRWGD